MPKNHLVYMVQNKFKLQVAAPRKGVSISKNLLFWDIGAVWGTSFVSEAINIWGNNPVAINIWGNN